MSAKGRRSNAWDDAHLRGPWTPVKWVLRALSSITLAVILLVFVALYGISASVPIGLLALAPTYLFYGLTIVAAITVLAMLPAWGWWKLFSRPDRSRALRFTGTLLIFLALAPAAVALWYRLAWPRLHYDPKTGSGVEFFADFVEATRATTLRRLPGMEMSELEYYAWWPLTLVLILFVVNMVVATLRRIDFTFKNIGVLTVHTGIVVIALGSVYYAGLKKEGDTLLLAGAVDPATGRPGPGPSQDRFFDNTRVSLYISQGRGWEQRLLEKVPRYNDYNLAAFSGESARELANFKQPWKEVQPARDLSLPVTSATTGLIDTDISFRVVGYARYATPVEDWRRIDAGVSATDPAKQMPLRIVYLHSAVPDEDGVVRADQPAFAFMLPPKEPAHRLAISRNHEDNRPLLSVEYTLGASAGMPEERWRDLSERLPEGTTHALVIELPATEGALAAPAQRTVVPVTPGQSITIGEGENAFGVRVKQITPTPPFPIITPGYRDATSSVAVVQVTNPKGEAYERYVYARYPELNQDIAGSHSDGRPVRRDASPEIRIALIETDHLAMYFDEPSPGLTRALVRRPGGEVLVVPDLTQLPGGKDGWLRDVIDKISLRVGARWDNAERTDRPAPVPEDDQERENLGNHKKAMLAIEVTSSTPALAGWRHVLWLPFSQYMGYGLATERHVQTPDGRMLTLAFGRLQHRFPNFELQLVDFQMLAYDHRGAPRDYQSRVRVQSVDDPTIRRSGAIDFDAYEHITKLNEPLRAPFMWSDDRAWLENLVKHLATNLSPHQFKLSQAGWDQQGWTATQQQADAGMIKGPYAKFTILGVGNNPGIHVIALGAILMGLGIPWAFYVKPWLIQREKRALAAMAAAAKGGGKAGAQPASTNVPTHAQPAMQATGTETTLKR